MISQIDRYRVVSVLGEGGFGKVYLAEDPALAGRRVAIKVLTTTDDASVRTRFRNEAVAAASLRHSNIVTILDYGEAQSGPFIVMEYLEGVDLAKRLATPPPLTLYQKVNILYQTACGLHAAHSSPKAIVHRDVKPANIMLLGDGTVKITDFGIARLANSDTRLTAANVLVGSVAYMAPEQLISGTSDVLTDIWSFGVLSYELIAEHHPFEGRETSQVLYRITTVEPPRLDTLATPCPADLAAVVARAMCKNREQRYSSLEDAIIDLNSVRTELNQAEARRMFEKAVVYHSEGKFEPALQALRAALEIDSHFRDARALREKINSELTRRTTRAKVDAACLSADEALRKGDLDGAISQLESAARLDPGDASVAGRLKELQKVKEAREQATQSLWAAERFLESDDLTAASRAWERVLRLDPGIPGAEAFKLRLSEAHARQEHARQVARALAEAEFIRDSGDLDSAIAVLKRHLQALSDNALSERLGQYEDLAAQRRAEIESLQQLIWQHLAGGDLSPAKLVCLDARHRYPGDPVFEQAWTEIEQREAAARRAEEEARAQAERVRAEAERAAAEAERARVEAERVRAEAERAKVEAERARAQADQAQLIIEVRRALGSGRLDEAASVIARGLSSYPDCEEFQTLQSDVREAIARRTEYRLATPAPVPAAQPAVEPAALPPVPAPEPAGEFPAQRSSRTRYYLLTAGAAAAVLIAFLGLKSYQNRATPPPASVQQEPLSAAPSQLEFASVPKTGPTGWKEVRLRPARTVFLTAPDWIEAKQSSDNEATVLSIRVLPPSGAASRMSGTVQVSTGENSSPQLQIEVAYAPVVENAAAAGDISKSPPSPPPAIARNSPEPGRSSPPRSAFGAEPTRGAAPESSRPKTNAPSPAPAAPPVPSAPAGATAPVVAAPPVTPAPVPPAAVSPAEKGSLRTEPPKPNVIRLAGPNAYMGVRSGTIIWTGVLDPGGRVTITGRSPSSGILQGGLEGVEKLSVTGLSPSPGVVIVEQPSEENGWNRLVLEAVDRIVNRIVVEWRIPRR
jgi:hypothetical protein